MGKYPIQQKTLGFSDPFLAMLYQCLVKYKQKLFILVSNLHQYISFFPKNNSHVFQEKFG